MCRNERCTLLPFLPELKKSEFGNKATHCKPVFQSSKVNARVIMLKSQHKVFSFTKNGNNFSSIGITFAQRKIRN